MGHENMSKSGYRKTPGIHVRESEWRNHLEKRLSLSKCKNEERESRNWPKNTVRITLHSPWFGVTIPFFFSLFFFIFQFLHHRKQKPKPEVFFLIYFSEFQVQLFFLPVFIFFRFFCCWVFTFLIFWEIKDEETEG